jgi:hypothetical protein
MSRAARIAASRSCYLVVIEQLLTLDTLGATGFVRPMKMFGKSYAQYSPTDARKLDLMLWRYGVMLLK